MPSRFNLNSVIKGVISFAVVVNAYAVGVSEKGIASCNAVECKEINGMADLTNPQQPPTTVNFDIFFTSGKSSYNVYAPNPDGGTDTQHNTLTVMHNHHCDPKIPVCNNNNSGRHEVSFGGLNCNTPASTPRWFCADPDGEGVDTSWHKDKKKDEE